MKLESTASCQQYRGLPENWLKDPHASMVWMPAGTFEPGSQLAYPDEQNFGDRQRAVSGFWMDQTEVTVAQFASFVQATHYVTDAEQQDTATVFSPDRKHPEQWWQLKSGYPWKTPYGRVGKSPAPSEPVRYVKE